MSATRRRTVTERCLECGGTFAYSYVGGPYKTTCSFRCKTKRDNRNRALSRERARQAIPEEYPTRIRRPNVAAEGDGYVELSTESTKQLASYAAEEDDEEPTLAGPDVWDDAERSDDRTLQDEAGDDGRSVLDAHTSLATSDGLRHVAPDHHKAIERWYAGQRVSLDGKTVGADVGWTFGDERDKWRYPRYITLGHPELPPVPPRLSPSGIYGWYGRAGGVRYRLIMPRIPGGPAGKVVHLPDDGSADADSLPGWEDRICTRVDREAGRPVEPRSPVPPRFLVEGFDSRRRRILKPTAVLRPAEKAAAPPVEIRWVIQPRRDVLDVVPLRAARCWRDSIVVERSQRRVMCCSPFKGPRCDGCPFGVWNRARGRSDVVQTRWRASRAEPMPVVNGVAVAWIWRHRPAVTWPAESRGIYLPPLVPFVATL